MSLGHVYEREGNVYHPTEWAGSPWSGRHQHGGPINALFATAALEASAEIGLRPARLTVDLFRAVPRMPLALAWRFVHRGRRIARVEATLCDPASQEIVSVASAVLLEDEAHIERSWDHTPPPPLPLATAEPMKFMAGSREEFPPGFHWSFEVALGADEHGAGAWITTPLDWLPGVPMSPWQRSAAVSDLAFGLSGRSLAQAGGCADDAWRVPLINVDTSIYWERAPTGDWFGFRHSLLTAEHGNGLAEIDLADSQGRIGRALQSLLANPAPKSR
jgi:hypothetical protein